MLLVGSGSVLPGESTVAKLPNTPALLMVAVTVMVSVAPGARVGIVHGKSAQPAPSTAVIARFVGVSFTITPLACDGPALATAMLYCTCCPIMKSGPVVSRLLTTDRSFTTSRVLVSVASVSPTFSTPSTVRVTVLLIVSG